MPLDFCLDTFNEYLSKMNLGKVAPRRLVALKTHFKNLKDAPKFVAIHMVQLKLGIAKW